LNPSRTCISRVRSARGVIVRYLFRPRELYTHKHYPAVTRSASPALHSAKFRDRVVRQRNKKKVVARTFFPVSQNKAGHVPRPAAGFSTVPIPRPSHDLQQGTPCPRAKTSGVDCAEGGRMPANDEMRRWLVQQRMGAAASGAQTIARDRSLDYAKNVVLPSSQQSDGS
jgi:hypothetical protein